MGRGRSDGGGGSLFHGQLIDKVLQESVDLLTSFVHPILVLGTAKLLEARGLDLQLHKKSTKHLQPLHMFRIFCFGDPIENRLHERLPIRNPSSMTERG